MFTEDALLPLSGLQHLLFCERQCALIHVEGLWEENRLTAEGRVVHDRTDQQQTEVRGDVRIARALRLRSFRLGLAGKADVVEFHRLPPVPAPVPRLAVRLPGLDGLWRPFPVEYKRGRPKPDHCDLVQLCAQALCLEEMLGIDLDVGALFYGKTNHRLAVAFTAELRAETEAAASRLHQLVQAGITPAAAYEKKCDSCSLLSLCMPKVTGSPRSVQQYLAHNLEQLGKECG